MDLMTLAGILAGLATLIGGYIWDGGSAQGLFFPTAVLVVFGGTWAATLAGFTGSQFKKIGSGLSKALFPRTIDQQEVIDELLVMAAIARRDGILKLESEAEYHPEPFIRDGLMIIVDGTDPAITQQMLEQEIEKVHTDGETQAKIFETAGGFAPTLGIIGTVLGLMNLLGNLQDPTLLAKSISIAFTATLYGVASANLIYLPIANKIRARTQEQVEDMELMMTGLLAIQNGDHPNLLRMKLQPFLRKPARAIQVTSEAGDRE